MANEAKWQLSILTNDHELNETRGGNSKDTIFQIIPRLLLGTDQTWKRHDNPFQNCTVLTFEGSTLGLIVESEVLIFDTKVEKVTNKISFTSLVDFVTWNRSLCVVGLSSSELIFLNPSTFEKLETRFADTTAEKIVQRNDERRFYRNGYISVNTVSGTCDIYAINIEGKVYCFHTVVAPDNTLDQTRLEKTILTNVTISQADAIQTLPKGLMVTASHFFEQKYLIVTDSAGNLTVLELTENTQEGIHFYRKEDSVNPIKDLGLLSEEVTIKKIVRCEGFIFALMSSGNLEIMFDDMLVLTQRLHVPIPNGIIRDFAVVVSDQDFKVWAIYGAPNDIEQTYIGIFSGPSFKPELIVSIPVSSRAATPFSEENEKLNPNFRSADVSIHFNQQNSLVDEPCALICVSSTGAKLFQVLETSTEIMIQRLLSQGKFDRASSLAEKYSIDADIVKKAKVQAYYNDLITPKSDERIENIFKLLRELLESIRDSDFVCRFCICDNNNIIPKVDWVKQVMSLGLRRATSLAGTEHGKRLLLLGKKFYTFEQVMPAGSIQDWREFCDPSNSMFEICKRFLQNHQYEHCNTVWSRHSGEFVTDLTSADLGQFFWALFCVQLKPPSSATLFTSVLADALEKCVQPGVDQKMAMDTMTELVKKQLCFLEQEVKWPKEAAEFDQTLIKVFQSEKLKYSEMIKHERLIEPEWEKKMLFCHNMTLRLEYLSQSLTELTELITAHAMRVPFTKFMQEDLYDVVNAMLDELFVREEILLFVKKFLTPFAKRKQLNVDELFKNHIESVVRNLPYFASSSSIPYEERLVCLVELVFNVQIKLESVLEMANNWPVPWSEGIDNLVTRILDMHIGSEVADRDECVKIQKYIAFVKRQVPFQCLIIKYRLTASKLETSIGVSMALKRILSSRKPTCVQDCFELIKFTGKRSKDDVLSLKFRLDIEKLCYAEMTGTELPLDSHSATYDSVLETLLPNEPNISAMEKMRDRCLNSVTLNPLNNSSFPKELVEKLIEAAHLLSKKLDSEQENVFLELRKFVPNLSNLSVMSDDNYPFVVVDYMMNRLLTLPARDVLEQCNSLGTVSFHPFQEIIVAVIFTILEQSPLSAALNEKVWSLITHVTQFPTVLQSPVLKEYIVFGLPYLIIQNPNISQEKQLVVESFLKTLISSFSSCSHQISKYIGLHQIFMKLREQEIPLEKEFLSIFKGLCGHEQKSVDSFVDELKGIGGGLIQYGEYDLMVTILNSVLLEYEGLKSDLSDTFSVKNCTEVISHVTACHEYLVNKSVNYRETEANPHVLNLVESVIEAGIYVNAYALRNRNKTKLINSLLSIKEFRLASEVALVFEYREKEQWSAILNGFMNDGNIQNLKSVLRSLKNITELWVLPEFSAAWIQVSNVYPDFKNLCPIPLY